MTDDDAIVSCVTLTASEYVAMLARGAELAKEITSLLNRLADERTENMRLRAALETISLMDKRHEHDLFSAACAARAALDGQPAPTVGERLINAAKEAAEIAKNQPAACEDQGAAR